MRRALTTEELISFGLEIIIADDFVNKINQLSHLSDELTWMYISKHLLTPTFNFELHLFLFSFCYPHWKKKLYLAPAWIPDEKYIQSTNIAKCIKELGFKKLEEFHKWSTKSFQSFWGFIIKKLDIVFKQNPTEICDLSSGVMHPNWLVNAKLNIADSCLTADPKKVAITFLDKNKHLSHFTYQELNELSDRIALSLLKLNYSSGDAIAINMPMNLFSIAIYLGIIKMGGVVVSIPDSFSKEEIASRLKISKTKIIFTQDVFIRNEKQILLYEKVKLSEIPTAIVLSNQDKLLGTLRENDIKWEDFLVPHTPFTSVDCFPDSPCNILFSSGTTGEPKAIPWAHTVGIKAASDAFLHQNIKPTSVLAWPTNLGWMMGLWLIFATLINKATIALYDDIPTHSNFGQFIQDAKVTMLGVVPTIVSNWRKSDCMRGFDWNSIECFSTTGECSNPEDMLYLMSLANYKPIIEYCGGTEIGGSYISSTMIENNYPSLFTTPVMGINFVIINDQGKIAEKGEVGLIPPSIGLSTRLLNADHDQIYYADMPKLPDGRIVRRHGDQIEQLSKKIYSVLGRADDTMNLSGIKISSVEIERTLIGLQNIQETAAIGIQAQTLGPTQLVIFAVTHKKLDKHEVKIQMQKRINEMLNPLFKIYDVILIKNLPKTASNKILRRALRDQYQKLS